MNTERLLGIWVEVSRQGYRQVVFQSHIKMTLKKVMYYKEM